jgi:hypothetical protein
LKNLDFAATGLVSPISYLQEGIFDE